LDFVQQRLSGLSEAFAKTPLMEMRISTPRASVRLVKAAAEDPHAQAAGASPERQRESRPQHEYVPDGEPGRAYDTVSAEVVGVFRAAPDLPAEGEPVESDRVLGYIESLKVQTPVRAGLPGRLVGQIAEDGQSVDFGETLFVLDSGPSENGAATAEPEEAEPPADLEPPRL